MVVRLAARAWQDRSTAMQGGAKPVASSTHLERKSHAVWCLNSCNDRINTRDANINASCVFHSLSWIYHKYARVSINWIKDKSKTLRVMLSVTFFIVHDSFYLSAPANHSSLSHTSNPKPVMFSPSSRSELNSAESFWFWKRTRLLYSALTA